MGTWINYFTATGSIASALTGLIFVGLSVNLKKIFCITKAHLPTRSLGSLALLTNIVFVCNFCLIPGQPKAVLGGEISIIAIAIWLTTSRLDLKAYHRIEDLYKKLYFRNFFFLQFSILPFLIAGILLVCGSENAFYVMVPGIIFSFIKSLLDTWFIIVDINKQ